MAGVFVASDYIRSASKVHSPASLWFSALDPLGKCITYYVAAAGGETMQAIQMRCLVARKQCHVETR